MLWHCSGGKDRTGFASALMPGLLGVDYQSIEDDYLSSNRYSDSGRGPRIILRLFRGESGADALGAVLEARASWPAAAFEAIDEQSGGFGAYRREALGLSDGDMDTLKDYYLE